MTFFHASLPSSLSSRMVCYLVAKSCPTLCNPMDCSPPGALFQARILGWVAISSSRGSSQPRDWTASLALAGGFFYQLSHQGIFQSKSQWGWGHTRRCTQSVQWLSREDLGHVKKMSWARVVTAWRWEGALVLRPEGRKQTCLGHQTAGFTPHTRKTIARCTTDPRQKCAHPPNPSKHHSPPQGGDTKGEQSDLAEAADRKKANLMHWPDHHQQFQPPKDITHIHTCACTHTHTYIPMRAHTHTHTHTRSQNC